MTITLVLKNDGSVESVWDSQAKAQAHVNAAGLSGGLRVGDSFPLNGGA